MKTAYKMFFGRAEGMRHMDNKQEDNIKANLRRHTTEENPGFIRLKFGTWVSHVGMAEVKKMNACLVIRK